MEGVTSQPEDQESLAVLVAVPEEAVEELVSRGLAKVIPTIRGPVFDAVLSIGSDSAVLVTLLQAPDAIRAFAVWLLDHARGRRDSIVITARRAGRRVELRVDGDVPVEAVAEFLSAAFRKAPDPTGES